MITYDSVDLFAGPGGLDLGAKAAGLVPVGVEWCSQACATRRAAGLPTIQGDVRRYGPADFMPATRLLAGPPCQTFTVAGDGAGRRALDTVLDLAKRMAAREDIYDRLAGLDDERTGLVLEPLRWALDAADMGRPYEAIVLEQVPAVLPVWQAYTEILHAEGYNAACGVLAAEQYGVPQTRRRAVLVARRDALVGLPAPTHRPWRRGALSEVESCRLPVVTMGDVLPHRGPFVVISNYGTGGDPKNRGRRLSTEPAATVTGKISRNRIVAPDGRELPRLTHSEAGVLQGFPADYPWTGLDIGQQIGNAVPVPLAAHIVAAATGLRLPAPATESEAA
ncbi:DNA cytosine methyltransferase [Streptomyces malaysiensis]|uniref:DNA cytosine methyltransferase n=1 Tax=Streptomyces malaysiensis TaxID=92644 RepID=UPI00367CA876